MSATTLQVTPPSERDRTPWVLPLTSDRGTHAMYLVILTEAFLFIALFFSYFFLEHGKDRWRFEEPPKLHYALPMLGILALSSIVLHLGEKQVKKENHFVGRVWLAVTVVLGLVFLVLSGLEYREHWRTLTPTTNAYGSIFYTIVSFHAAHLIVGLLILIYVGVLPSYAPTDRSPYKPYHVASLYWHFVDIIWFFVVLILYLSPRWGRL